MNLALRNNYHSGSKNWKRNGKRTMTTNWSDNFIRIWTKDWTGGRWANSIWNVHWKCRWVRISSWVKFSNCTRNWQRG